MQETNELPHLMFQNKTILIADHSEVHRLLLADYLVQLGFSCVLFENAEKLISDFDRHPQSVILLEIEFPGIKGIEIAQATKSVLEKSGKRHIYVAMSARGDDLPAMGAKAGFDDYLQKPVTKNDLQACLHRHLPHKDDLITPLTGVLFSAGAESKLYSLKMFEDDDPEFVRSIIEIFVFETPGYMESIRNAFEMDNMAELKLIAHKIKPHFGFFGAFALQNTFQKLEDIGAGILGKDKFTELMEYAERESSLLVSQLNKDFLA